MTKKPNTLTPVNGRLARRLGTYVILASTLIALFTTAVQIYSEYSRDIRHVHEGLNQIEKTHLSNIASRIWVLDTQELKATLENLLSIQSIQYIAAFENGNLLMEAGLIEGDNTITKNYPLNYEHNNKQIHIGNLLVKASLDKAYQHVIDRAMVILISNAVKTFIVAGFILLIFYKLVAQHLEKIATFSEQLNINNLDNTFEFDRKKNPADKQDELDLLKTSLYKMQKNLLAATQDREDSQSQVKLILNSTAEAIFGINTDGECTFINKACLDMLGYEDSTELLGRNMHELMHHSYSDGSHYPVDKCPIFGALVQEKPSQCDSEVLWRKDGSCFSAEYWSHPIFREGECVGAVVTFLEITDRIETLHALQEREQNLAITLNSMLDAVITTDQAGVILTFNRAAELLFGYQADEIIGQYIKQLVPRQHADEHDNYLQHYLDTDDSKIIGQGREVQAKRKVGDTFPMRLRVAKLAKDSEGKQRYITSCLDLTQLRLQEAQLRRSQKMDALGKLTGGISHDYNNMLGVIMGYADLLEESLADQPNLAYYAHQILHAGKRGSKLTRKLLVFSSQKASDEEILDINELLLEEKHLLEKSLTARIKMSLHLTETPWPVKLDGNDLKDSILNLCINSMHAMDSGGELTIETCNELINSADAQFQGIEEGEYVRLSVSDTGCGMDEATKEKIFDPFFSTKGELGTGLGLSQTYGFVDRCGGTIKVYSELGHGTRIALYFPRHRKNSSHVKKLVAQDTADLSGTETILVVDDEPTLLNLTSEILGQQGYHVLCAERGKQALDVLKNNNVDLLLSDVIMPEMDGYELAIVCQKEYPELKIQLASGFTDQRHINMSDDKLHNNLLQKPYNARTLLQKIRELLDF